MKKVLVLLSVVPSLAFTAPLNDFQFKSPSFSGIGYGAHVLTIENQEATRRKAAEDKIQAELEKAKNEAKNTNIAKFMNNLESRIYAQISQNLATAMFASGGATSGTLNFEGNTIFWNRDSSAIYLTVTDTVGSQTQITIPLGSFQF